MIKWFKEQVWNRVTRAWAWTKAKVVSWVSSISPETVQLVVAGCALTAVAVGAFALLCKCLPLVLAFLILLGLIAVLRQLERCLLPPL